MLLLQIMKWILIILTVLLLFILGAIFIVLLVPFRYRAAGEYNADQINFNGKVSWLFHLISAGAVYNNGFCFRIKIMGIPVFDSGRQKKKSAAVTAEARIQSVTKPEPEAETPIRDELLAEEPDSVSQPSSGGINAEETVLKAEHEKKRKKSSGREVSIRYYLGLFRQEETQRVWKRLKYRIKAVVISILPRQYQVTGTIGFEDPSLTGYLMGVLGAASPFIGTHIRIVPDFEEKKVELTGFLKGKIRIGIPVFHGMTLLIDKEFRGIIKKLTFSQQQEVEDERK